MKTALLIIQARMGSSRLPGKMTAPLAGGEGALRIMLRRLTRSRFGDSIVVATTILAEDDALAALCGRLMVPCYRGSPNDVLDRCHSAYLAHGPAQAIARLTGDCPLHDPAIVDSVIERFLGENVDYAANLAPPTWPDGLDVEVFGPDLLETMWREARLPSEREHVTQFVYNHPDRFRTLNVVNDADLSDKRWTLDEPEDLEFIRAVLGELGDGSWGYRDVLRVLAIKPELEAINSLHRRNEGLEKSKREEAARPAPPPPAPWEGRGRELYQRAKRVIPGGTQLLSKRPEMYLPDGWPAYYSRARGCEVWDLDGRHYFDFTNMSVGACPLGYADPDVDAAVREAIARGNMSTLNAPEEVELAELLIELHPWAGGVRYARGGGEAMAVAVRIARAATGRDRVAICGYHGWHDWYLSVNLGDNTGLDGHHLPGLDPTGTPRALKGTAATFMAGDLDALEAIVRRHGDQLAAVVMEPLRNDLPPPGYLGRVRELAHSCGALLVFDEVSAGFRLCCGGSHLALGVNPDIAVLAKGMSNGYPMGAVFGTGEAMSGAQKSFISSTYWTDRLGPAAALACIRKYRALKAHERQKAVGEKLLAGWEALGRKHGLPIHAGGIPALAHFSIAGEWGRAARTLFAKLMLEGGYLAGPGVYPTWAHTEDLADAYLAIADRAFERIAGIGLSEKLPDALAPCGVAHSGFRRLN
jgi:glutamate-1-semialdehyde 2,1-aminomutase